MGLLTDPRSGQGKLTKLLIRFYKKFCVLLYVGGIFWFCALASPSLNANTYFSENALLPGLVKSMFQEDKAAMRYYEELVDETDKYDNSIPYPWLLAKFSQIGLDAYTHNFTLKSPLNPKEKYVGKNVYGILRAPRASSTEALVLSVPYRPPSSIYPPTLPSIAIALAFAKFAVRGKYWAKDIIFLVTDHEQLGVQAWLEAYYGVTCGNEGTLIHGDLKGRAGAIQAAINLELHSTKIGNIDIKIESLNGQLPNLDLVNLASKICAKEGVYYTFKGKGIKYIRNMYKEWKYYFKNMLSMISTQSTGIPNGNHGLFLRFGIQALTLEGFEQSKNGARVGFLTIGRVIEGIFRSMNNLLERFHQSFFFYLLPSPDRYISIGLYMPAICLIAAALIIKACAKWCQLHETNQKETQQSEAVGTIVGNTVPNINYLGVIILSVTMHLTGAFLTALPELVIPLASNFEVNVSHTVVLCLLGVILSTLFIPFVLGRLRRCSASMDFLCIISLLELGTALICLAMNNFSLGIICGILSVPFALLIRPTTCKYYSAIQKLFWLIVHPATILFIVVLVNTKLMFKQEDAKEVLFRAVDATEQSILYSITDSMIYGNWLYTVVTSIFISNWLCFWCVACSSIPKPVVSSEKKND
ncbi:glycosylphosphatidylinositol anchor attachment 1 protein [Sitophilus oryzae]|uniref:Glycosylphosphatidylinositol anchor attachment 1 protein n=1 Tax=Sitophilus oryzae TaxID=7048 RepID=A0A6J2XSQ8_SITOR|nr:glycosylphosphatidylinositol anchor attachment 1 protein [Sitophilus oryzae]